MGTTKTPLRIAVLFTLVLGGSVARAAVFVVTTTADSGPGSLRDAIDTANSTTPTLDTILFNIPGTEVHTITLESEIDITDSLIIDGYTQPGSSENTDPASSNAVILIDLEGTDGNQNGLMVTGGTLEIHGVSLRRFQTALGFMAAGGSFVGGCFVGLFPSGDIADGNTSYGIASAGTGPDTIGDGTPANRNVISGNTVGVAASNAGGGTIVRGNLIGTNAAGTAALPNGTGILSVVGIQVGGAPGQGNVISGNSSDGVHVTCGPPSFFGPCGIVGNLVGLDVTGMARLGNGAVGIYTQSESATIDSNIVSANGSHGIDIQSSIFLNLTSNTIGLNVLGSGDLGNQGAGIHTVYAGQPNIVGNSIANNQAGIWMEAQGFADPFEIGANEIFENGGLGIVDGGTLAIHPNGVGFPFPLITSVTPGPTTTNIQGFYDSPGTLNSTIRFFSSPACSKKRPWQFDEGKTYLGSILTPGGHVAFSFDAPVVLTDEVVTATGTFTVCGPCASVADGGSVIWIQTGPFSQRLPFSISPASGDPAGGTPLVIAGTNFASGATITIGGQPVGNPNIPSATEIDGTAPALPAGSVNDVTVVNLDGTHGTLQMAYLADFLDVPPVHAFHEFVRTIATNGIAAGVGGGNFGVDAGTLRQQMAVFLLKAKHGYCWTPPPCTGIFTDVPCPSTFADWIETLAAEGITGGCGGGNYCPTSAVRRDQMAAFLLKAEHGSAYVPPPCAGLFGDVACPSLFADWIERLAAEQVTGGCGGGNYCPSNPNTRGQMAVFLTKTFGLP